MGQLTSREMILMIVVIILGLAFFAAVCVTIYYIFKRLENKDREENAHFNEGQDNKKIEPQSDIPEP